MRIIIEDPGEEKKINLIFPNRLIFNKLVAWIGSNAIKKHAGGNMPELSTEQLNKLFCELNRIKRKYGKFELVHVESCDGEKVQIIL